MKKSGYRELTESSYLAMSISDKASEEFSINGPSSRYQRLVTLLYIVNEADDPQNPDIYYQNYQGIRQIVIRNIPSLFKHGLDFTRDKMRGRLYGLAETVKDVDGAYLVDVKITHDLNSAIITDLQMLLIRI